MFIVLIYDLFDRLITYSGSEAIKIAMKKF